MPCYNPMSDDRHTRVVYATSPKTKKQIEKLEAMLCLLMGHFERTKTIVSFEPEEVQDAGVDERDLNEFWDEHRQLDAIRRKIESEKRHNAEARRRALLKLTPEEQALLGVK